MTNIMISGALGRMGRAITAMVKESDKFNIVCGVDVSKDENCGFPIYQSFDMVEDISKIDCIIDFSNIKVLHSLMDFAVKNKIPTVVATTGLSEDDKEYMNKSAESIPVFYSANMSLGINVIAELCKQASIALGMDYDIEIIEKHHNKKLDSPSGTALLLADEINSVNHNYKYIYDRSQTRKAREKNEIGIYGVRGGGIVGEHEVIFAGEQEVISISHSAFSRDVFANGALRASEFIKGKNPGIYNMTDIVKGAL